MEEIIELGFPVFARYITPRSGTADKLGDVEKSIVCGSVVVNPDDFIVGDINGVLVIPNALIDQVVNFRR